MKEPNGIAETTLYASRTTTSKLTSGVRENRRSPNKSCRLSYFRHGFHHARSIMPQASSIHIVLRFRACSNSTTRRRPEERKSIKAQKAQVQQSRSCHISSWTATQNAIFCIASSRVVLPVRLMQDKRLSKMESLCNVAITRKILNARHAEARHSLTPTPRRRAGRTPLYQPRANVSCRTVSFPTGA